MGAPHGSVVDRFHRFIEPEPNSGCWLWNGCITGHGYGQLRIARHAIYSHRVSWELHRGVIPIGLDVLHRCDSPPCVNPNHLFLGTATDNALDMVRKGRGRKPKIKARCK